MIKERVYTKEEFERELSRYEGMKMEDLVYFVKLFSVVIVTDGFFDRRVFTDIINELELRYPTRVYVDLVPIEFDREIDGPYFSTLRQAYETDIVIRKLKNMREYMRRWFFAARVIFITDKAGYRYVSKGREEYLLGYAETGGQIMSIYLRHVGEDPDWITYEYDKYKFRMLKLVLHEFGHTLGLRHCNSEFCIMRPTRSAKDYDSRGYVPCKFCNVILRNSWPEVYDAWEKLKKSGTFKIGVGQKGEELESRFFKRPD